MVPTATRTSTSSASAEDELEASSSVIVRRGRVVGRTGFVLDKVMALESGEVVARTLEELYYDNTADGNAEAGPRPVRARRPRDLRAVADRTPRSRVEIRVPQRGDKRKLQETVTQNANEVFARHRLRPGVGPQQPGPGASTSCRTLELARGAAAHRVLRH